MAGSQAHSSPRLLLNMMWLSVTHWAMQGVLVGVCGGQEARARGSEVGWE